jgi:DNA-binding MarR family transcriptional regulator
MTENQQFILKTMKEEAKPMRPGDIAKSTGLDKDAVSKAIKELKTMGLVNSPKRCFYAPIEK